MDAVIFILAWTESEQHLNVTKRYETKSPHDDGPMEQFSHSSGHRFQFYHKWRLHAHERGMRAACLGSPVALGSHPVPRAHSLHNCLWVPFPNAPIPCSCWSHRSTVTNPVNFISPTDVINSWDMHPSVFQWHEGGAASFSAPSSPSLPAPSCRLPAIHLGDSCSSHRTVWGLQANVILPAEINWAEYLWSCLLRRKVSGCAKFRKLMKRREKSRNRCFSSVCVCVW